MKILVVDDHALFREGLSCLLRGLEDNTDVLEARDYDETMQVLVAHPDLDLLLLDLNLPGRDGFSVLEAIVTFDSTMPVAVLSASRRRSDIERVMSTSAMGFIPKDTTSEVMLSAVRLILAGGIYTPPAPFLDAGETDVRQSRAALTRRQIEVLAMLLKGLSNKRISADLGIAQATTKMHITAIFKALGVTNRTQAALAAQSIRLDLPAELY